LLLCHSFLIYLEPLHFDAGKYRIYVSRPPSSGVIFAFIYNIMLVFNDRGQLDIENPADFHHKLIEAFKVFKVLNSNCWATRHNKFWTLLDVFIFNSLFFATFRIFNI
jgi:hypothetical protein